MSKPIANIIVDLAERDLIDLGRRVAAKHACTLEEAVSQARTQAFVDARHELWAILQATGNWTYKRIGALFGRDHTSVIHGVRQHYLRQMKGAA